MFVASPIGCGKAEVQEEFKIENFQGSIDETLAPSVQKKQDAIIRLFNAIQDVGIENYKWDCSDIQFKEDFKEFFGDAVSIERWEWAAAPDGDNVSVKLVLKNDDEEGSMVESIRVYSVKRQGGLYKIVRQP